MVMTVVMEKFVDWIIAYMKWSNHQDAEMKFFGSKNIIYASVKQNLGYVLCVFLHNNGNKAITLAIYVDDDLNSITQIDAVNQGITFLKRIWN